MTIEVKVWSIFKLKNQGHVIQNCIIFDQIKKAADLGSLFFIIY